MGPFFTVIRDHDTICTGGVTFFRYGLCWIMSGAFFFLRACVTPSAVKNLLRFSVSPFTGKKIVFFFVLQHFPSGKFVQRPKNVPFYIFNQKSYFDVFRNGLTFIEIVL